MSHAIAETPSPRRVIPLCDDWKFHKGDSDAALEPAASASDWESVQLPHTWNARDGQDGGGDYYRGPGWYRRALDVPAELRDRRLFLRFGAANTVADVYVNGKHVGQHRGGFAAFCYEITPLVEIGAQNRIAVRVDNSHFDDVPPWSADFTFFGGLYRDVELLVLSPTCITPLDYASPGVYLRPVSVSAERAEIEVTTKLLGTASAKAALSVVTIVQDAGGTEIARATATPDAARGEQVVQKLALDQPHLWDGRRDPYLYSVRMQLTSGGRVVDEIVQPLGLRWLDVDPQKGCQLNGHPIRLYGVNRHQDRLDRGWAIGPREHEEDIALIREMGCTAVRLAHYQQDDYVYTLCDRAGLIVWAEIPLVDRIDDTPAFLANARQQLIELIRQNYNHPSILFWGVHNEVTAPWAKGPDPTAVVHELAELVHAEDPSRRSVCAATDPVPHPANWQTDLVAFNRYFGWYHGDPREFAPWLNALHREHPNSAIGISEYGAGASIQHHEASPKRPQHDGQWHPEEWQARVHEAHWRAMRECRYLWCTFVWNMFDFASDRRNEGDTPGRNDKGLVTYDRKTRKDAFYWYKAQWSDEPFVYITSRRFDQRKGEHAVVRVYSNCEAVELLVNGHSCGVRRDKDGVFQWSDVPLQLGDNTIAVQAQHGDKRCEDQCKWTRTE